MRFIPSIAVGLCAATIPFAASALEKLSVYERFNGTTPDLAHWAEGESIREIVNGALHVRQRAPGSKSDNTGLVFPSFGLDFATPSKVRDIGATVTVNEATTAVCAGNTQVGWSGARLIGDYFNAGTPTPGSLNGDVVAEIRVARFTNSTAAAGTLSVKGSVVKCTSATCDASVLVGSVDLGTVQTGTATKLYLRWDAVHNAFLFKRDAQAYKTVKYKLKDSAAPGTPFKAMGVRSNVPSCTTGSPEGLTDATFDTVYTNTSALP